MKGKGEKFRGANKVCQRQVSRKTLDPTAARKPKGNTGDRRSRAEEAFRAVGFGTGVDESVALAVEADDEHGTSVAIARGLAGSENGNFVTAGGDVSDTLAETAMAEFVGAAEEIDAAVGVVGSKQRLHGAIVLVAQR
jgi:hypothetical protein